MDPVADLLRVPADQSGVAIIDPDTGWILAYEELATTVEFVGAQLLGAGARPGAGVGLVFQPGPEAVIAFLAVARIGAIAMPLNPLLHSHEMAHVFDDVPPRVVIVDENGNAAAEEAASSAGAPIHVFASGPGAQLADVRPSKSALPGPDPDDIALVLHTSGTTSRPKVVPLRQRNIASSARAISASYQLTHTDVSYCLMPLFHVHGLVASVLATLASGGKVVIPRRVRPRAFWSHVAERDVTWFSAVPTILSRLPKREAGSSLQLRFARSCSSALSPAVWTALEERFGVPIVEAYGMTEAAHQMATNPLPPEQRRPGTVGKAAGTDIAVADESWRQLGPGIRGEVLVRGPGVIDRYGSNPEADAVSFRDGWFRTGDVGQLSADGYLSLEGRVKELINRGGEKIAPREIDEALLGHPCVQEAVAFGVPDEKYGEIVHAAVVLASDVDPDSLRRYCEDRVASFKVPRQIHIVTEIPTGPTGKVQRTKLAEMLST